MKLVYRDEQVMEISLWNLFIYLDIAWRPSNGFLLEEVTGHITEFESLMSLNFVN
jgi:hypothetical protein